MTTSGQTSKGGQARAKALSAQRRKEIARQASRARWDNTERPAETIPQATHTGELKIGDIVLPCAVLADGTRIITEASVAKTLGRGWGGKTRRLGRARDSGPPLPVFLSGGTLEPFVPKSLRMALTQPKMYTTRGGVRRGVEATLLPEICEAWLEADDAGVLKDSQKHIARNAQILSSPGPRCRHSSFEGK